MAAEARVNGDPPVSEELTGGAPLSTAGNSDLTSELSVMIEASPEDVWAALTQPTAIKRWFFGVDTETDWVPGNSIVHRGEWQGRPYEDKGTILRFEPLSSLIHTHWSAMSGLPDEPQHYQEVRWFLEPRDGGTMVTLEELNLPSEDAKATSEQAWATALDNLKGVAELDRDQPTGP
jgi:uncharacterized protein YndB with AHSA1/START domain